MRLFKAILSIFLSILFFVLSAYFTMRFLLKTQDTVVCPDVVGKEINEAKRLVESKGLFFHVVRYEKRNDIPYNHITVQKPAANITTKKGRTVLVVVSDGPELITVPQLMGQDINRIDEVLKDKKVSIEKVIYVPDDNEGKILAQAPMASETIPEGKGITVFVGSRVRRYVLMPDLKDVSLNEIKEELTRKRIAFKITYTNGDVEGQRYNITGSIPKGFIFDRDEGLELKISPRREDE